ncbi:MAG: RIP metalloprotease RseP [bacterium]
MLLTVYTLLMVLVLFGLTIFVHELGHFLAARRCGMIVEVFAIGFGPPLWQRRINGVTYKIGCIPFGGYVSLPQLDPAGMQQIQGTAVKSPEADGVEAAAVALPPISPWKKIVVSVAGAFGNLVLALILAWVVYAIGKPASPSERNATIGYVATNSAAYAAGLRVGDEVLSVNNEPVKNWVDCLMAVCRYTNVTLGVRNASGTIQAMVLQTEKGFFGEQTLAGVDGRSLSMVLAVESGSTAERAGVQSGDMVVGFDRQEVVSRAHLVALVGARKGQPTAMRLKRGAAFVETVVTPAWDEGTQQVRIGIRFNTMDVEFEQIVHPKPSEQLYSHSMAIFRILGALTTPGQARAASGALGGPVAIMISYWYMVKISLMLAVFFTGFLNVNLAILNLLPIPVLDGGHVVFALYEAVFRRPLPVRIVNYLTNLFAILLIGVFVLLTFRDLRRFTPAERYLKKWFGHETPAPGTNAIPALAPLSKDPVP